MPESKPSFTAYLIPKTLSALGRQPKYRSVITHAQTVLSKRFADECARHDLGIAIAHHLIGAKLAVKLLDRLAVKGQPVHFAMRKKYIRDKLENIAPEIEQVVMIGAGFDTLCLEYHVKYPNIRFFELDRPEMQNVKLAAVAKLEKYADNLFFVGCDLAKQNLSEVLKGRVAYDINAKTLFIIEGVLMYLQKAHVEHLFAEIAKSAPSGSYVIFGSMSELKQDAIRSKFSDATLEARSEKYQFAASIDEIGQMVNSKRFELLEAKQYHELQEMLNTAAETEALKKERGEHYYFAKKA